MSQRTYRLPVPDMQATNSPRENISYSAVAQNPDMLGFLVGNRGDRMAASATYMDSMQRLAEMQSELFRMAEEGERYKTDVDAMRVAAENPDAAMFMNSVVQRLNPNAVPYIAEVGPAQRLVNINRTAAQANEANSAAGIRPPQGSPVSNFGLPIAPRTQGVPTSVMAAAAGNTRGEEAEGRVTLDAQGRPVQYQLPWRPGTAATTGTPTPTEAPSDVAQRAQRLAQGMRNAQVVAVTPGRNGWVADIRVDGVVRKYDVATGRPVQ